MGNFDQGGGSGGGFQDRGRPGMHPAICDKCGRACEVPFKPTGERPVFCQDCFRKESPAVPRPFGGHDAGRPPFGEKRMFEATCAKCGSRCEVPFRPSAEKPAYCRACFGQRGGGRVERAPESSKSQFDILNAKLDKILRALIPAQPQSAPVSGKPGAEAVAPQPKMTASPVAAAPTKVKKAVGKKKAPAKKAAKSNK